MDYRIVEKEAFEATGKVSIIFQGNNELPDLEVYYEGDTSADDYRCEVWIPVIKK